MPAGLGVVGGAAVDPSGGGNGDPDGPAAPPIPSCPARPADLAARRPGDRPGGRTGTPGGGIIVTLPDGRTVTLPPGVTAATSGIRGVDFAAPAFLRKPRLSATRFRAARRGRAFVAVRTGTRISYALNEPARVTLSVQKFRHLSRVCRRKARPQEPPPHRHALPQVDLGQGPLLEAEPGGRELRALPRPAQGQGAQARRATAS